MNYNCKEQLAACSTLEVGKKKKAFQSRENCMQMKAESFTQGNENVQCRYLFMAGCWLRVLGTEGTIRDNVIVMREDGHSKSGP